MASEFLRQFFALYKSYPCLWNKNHPKYRDKFEKDEAMMQLTKKYRELSPDATQVTVRKEMITFKSCLQKEHKRRKEALNVGLPVKSDFLYYDDLSFLLNNDAVFQKKKNFMQPKILTAKSLIQNKNTLERKNNLAPAVKKKKGQDKFDLLADKLRCLPAEQCEIIENILLNIFKFGEYENQEWIRTSSAVTRRQTPQKPVVAKSKIVQRRQSKPACTQTSFDETQASSSQNSISVQTNLNSPPRSRFLQNNSIQTDSNSLCASQCQNAAYVQTNLNSFLASHMRNATYVQTNSINTNALNGQNKTIFVTDLSSPHTSHFLSTNSVQTNLNTPRASSHTQKPHFIPINLHSPLTSNIQNTTPGLKRSRTISVPNVPSAQVNLNRRCVSNLPNTTSVQANLNRSRALTTPNATLLQANLNSSHTPNSRKATAVQTDLNTSGESNSREMWAEWPTSTPECVNPQNLIYLQ